LRAVRALHDPVWTADGYVSDRWRPVSPVSGRLDAFVWQMPLAALPSDKSTTIESSPFEEAMLAPRRVGPPKEGEQPAEMAVPPAAQDNLPANSAPAAVVEPAPVVATTPPPAAAASATPAPTAPAPAPADSSAMAVAPLFRARGDLGKPAIAPVIPIIRAPDDPGIDDEAVSDEFTEQVGPVRGQAGGWRGFLARWGG
jgi:HemY protein